MRVQQNDQRYDKHHDIRNIGILADAVKEGRMAPLHERSDMDDEIIYEVKNHRQDDIS